MGSILSGDGTHRGHPHPPASQQAGQGWVPHPNGPRCRIPVVGELIRSTVGSADQDFVVRDGLADHANFANVWLASVLEL